MVYVASDAFELLVSRVDAYEHRFSDGIVPFALRPGIWDGQFVRAEGLFRGKWPHAFSGSCARMVAEFAISMP